MSAWIKVVLPHPLIPINIVSFTYDHRLA